MFMMVFLLPAMMVSSSRACTVFYIYKDGRVLAASNEDWSDPNTKMWFYPASADRHGWVKFGFAGGFPQAGMNDCGMFWDGTAGPYLGMPYSEENKILYDGPLMQKLMEECSGIPDAIEVFDHYYCQDQYRAQYLVGGAAGYSMIVEGDNIIHNDYGFQVLTNFYQSEPELGGYPCWRFDKAVEKLENCDSITDYFMGTVLAATHQDGKYPTQYSLIFDPQQSMIYLFYYHNYDEFLLIDLADELAKDTSSYSIPPIFSRIKMIGPDNGTEISSDSIVLKWRGLPGSSYELVVSDGKSFHLQKAITAETALQDPVSAPAYLIALLLPVVFFIRRRKASFFLLLLVSAMILVSCNKSDDEEPAVDPTVLMSEVVYGLEANKTYYWKIIATPQNSKGFGTRSLTYSFKST